MLEMRRLLSLASCPYSTNDLHTSALASLLQHAVEFCCTVSHPLPQVTPRLLLPTSNDKKSTHVIIGPADLTFVQFILAA